MQASSFENYIAEKPFTDRFVQQSLSHSKKVYRGKAAFNKNFIVYLIILSKAFSLQYIKKNINS
ncbi:hypothetical protein J538_1992 [Acinetobacter sp. 272263]|nr:hypothetical protein J538_1992 [Acinetobacter sp. 272263]